MVTKNNENVVYAIQTSNIGMGSLKIIHVKIGKTNNIKSTIAQYKRSSIDIKVLNLWFPNNKKTLSQCEKGVHEIAEKFAHIRKGEKFIFLSDTYPKFEQIISLILEETFLEHTVKSLNNKSKTKPELKRYAEEDHIKNSSKKSLEIYNEVKEKLLSLGEGIIIKPRKFYIAFKSNKNFADIKIQKSQIKLFLNLHKGELKDPLKKARDVSTIGHWGNGDYEIPIKNLEDIDYIINLVKQSYDKN